MDISGDNRPPAPSANPHLVFAEAVQTCPVAELPTCDRLAGIATNLEGALSKIFRTVVKQPDPYVYWVEGRWKEQTYDFIMSSRNELRLLRTVRPHENIVRYFGVIEGVGTVLEYLDGPMLYTAINQRAYPGPVQIVSWVNQCIRGLAHIHSYNLSHGDISSYNILITTDNVIKFIDFGRSSAPGETCHPGSLYFTAPEIRLRESDVDGILADAYSIGVVFAETVRWRTSDTRDWDHEEHIAVLRQGTVYDTSDVQLLSGLIRSYVSHRTTRSRVAVMHVVLPESGVLSES
ncbi:kinase-like protein [Exidia glandulosa HHB12029]|uniref:Kinase-like protein n=1 Tax=Exidia glandulosa HHB12029 TaxID=1314781 RepID=A0A165F2Q3_EXIGL|nr:kinase-like protein [Exidia glandulosa HHB12029]